MKFKYRELGRYRIAKRHGRWQVEDLSGWDWGRSFMTWREATDYVWLQHFRHRVGLS